MQNQSTVEAVRVLKCFQPLNCFSDQCPSVVRSEGGVGSTKATATISATDVVKNKKNNNEYATTAIHRPEEMQLVGGTAPVSGCALPLLWTRQPVSKNSKAIVNSHCLSLETLTTTSRGGGGGVSDAGGWVSTPPKVELITHPVKGRCFVATMPIQQGECILVDTSELSAPVDASCFNRFNSQQPSAMQIRTHHRDPEVAKFHQEEETALLADCAMMLRKAATMFGQELLEAKGLQCLLALIAQHGDTFALPPITRPTVNISSTVLAAEADKETLRRKNGRAASATTDPPPVTDKAQPNQQKMPKVIFKDGLDRFKGEKQQKSDDTTLMVDQWMSDWCHHLEEVEDEVEASATSSSGTKKAASRRSDTGDSVRKKSQQRWEHQWRTTADAVLSVVPEDYCFVGLDPADLATAGEAVVAADRRKKEKMLRKIAAVQQRAASAVKIAGVLEENREEEEQFSSDDEGDQEASLGEVPVKMGFLARIGLSTVEDLVRFFAVIDANYTEIQVPGLETRLGLFPILRFLEHECRPNAVIGILDNLDSHSDIRQRNSEESIVHPDDPYGDNPEALTKELRQVDNLRKGVPRDYLSRKLLSPSTAIVTASRAIEAGDPVSISYIPSTYMVQPQRQTELLERHRFTCVCKWCTTEPDLARAFRCPQCDRNQGVVCPTGDGLKFDQWICLQCGWIPDMPYIDRCFDAERLLGKLRANPESKNSTGAASSMVKLLGDEYLHYTHSIVFRKCDEWSEKAWKDQDAALCLNYIEALIKCSDRVLPAGDPTRAQYHEFHGQLHHALGNAHTSRAEYQTALRIREAAGHQLMYWTARTRFMAQEKSLANLMDSK